MVQYDYVEVTRDVDTYTPAVREKVDVKRSGSRKRFSLKWGHDGLHGNPTQSEDRRAEDRSAIGTAV